MSLKTNAYDERLDRMALDFQIISDTYSGTAPADPFPLLAALRETQPVMAGDILARFNVPSQADYGQSGRPVMTVFRYNDVLAIMKDPVNWKSYINGDGFGAAVDNFMLTAMDGEVHAKFRAVLQPSFALQVIARMKQTVIEPNIKAILDPLVRHGKAELVRQFTLPFPVRVVYAVLGFPEDPDALMKFAGWAIRILGGPQLDPAKAAVTIPAAMEAGQLLFEHVLPIVRARRASGTGGEDLIGFMLQAELDGKKFTDEEITSYVRGLLVAASETTSRTFGNMLTILFQNPALMEKIREDRQLIPAAITETMRFDPAAGFLARIAAKDMEVCGTVIQAGTAVSLSISAANRDPEAYERPNEISLGRPPRPVLSFGFGPHTCLGMPIAKAELEAALNMLLDLPNLRLDPEYPSPAIRGIQLRGPDAIHVVWDVA